MSWICDCGNKVIGNTCKKCKQTLWKMLHPTGELTSEEEAGELPVEEEKPE